jgi:aspartate aminotransferase
VSAAIKKKNLVDDIAFAEYLIEKTGIALVPGSAFGGPGCIRLSFAISQELLMEAVKRLEQVLKE